MSKVHRRSGGVGRACLIHLLVLVLSVLALPGTVLAGSVTLSWGGVPGATGYRVAYGTASQTYTSTLDAGNNTTATVSPLTDGTRYYFAVQAYNATATSGYSAEVSAIVSAAPAPPMEVGEATVDHRWQRVDAPVAGGVVLAGPPTYRDADPGVVRVRNIDDQGFELRFQEWDYRDGWHRYEDVPYVVLQSGRYTLSDGSVWEVGTFDLGGTRSWASVAFTAAFARPPHLFLTVQTDNGPQAVAVRARNLTVNGFQAALVEQESLNDGHTVETIGYLAIHSPSGGGFLDLDGTPVPYLMQSLTGDERWSPVLSHRLRVEEERSSDSEVDHPDETLHVLALGAQILAQQVSDNNADTTALRRLPPTTAAPLEWGLLRGVDHNWTVLPFAKRYTTPVVIAKPVSNTGADPGVIRLKGVTRTHAQVRYQEWDYLDGEHAREDLFYLIAEAGEHNLAGLTVEARRLATNRLAGLGQWASVGFAASFDDTPVVLSAVMTASGTDAVTTRLHNLSATGFELAMDEQESKSDGHVTETLGWIALQRGSATTRDGRRLQVFTTELSDLLTTVAYPTATSHRHPSVVADITSSYGPDPVFLRYANPSNTAIRLKLAEEQSEDSETSHVLEDVGIFVGE